jgi:sugar phosphate isomerase/epimerase
MRIGVDSYSYHRLLGDVRPGEDAPLQALRDGSSAVVGEARLLGAEVVSLETAFLPPPSELDAQDLRRAAAGLEVVLAWGHPDGLAWGEDPASAAELTAWIRLAPRLGCRLLRVVAASPRIPLGSRRGERLATLTAALRRAGEAAARHGVAIALENHADLTAAQIATVVGDCPGLSVCLDTANALRMGDDPVAAARLLGPHVVMVHLKDCGPSDAGHPVAGPPSVPFGTGVVDLPGVLSALADRPAGLPVCVEVAQLPPGADERELVAQGVAWLRAWREAEVGRRQPSSNGNSGRGRRA